jgi:hypothetical protein
MPWKKGIRYLPFGLAVEFVAFGESTFIHARKCSPHPGMNKWWGRLDNKQQWLANNWIGILSGAVGAVLVWFITNWIGKPILDIRDKRIKALQAAEQNAYVDRGAGNKRVTQATTALNEAASGLRSISRGYGWPVRLYCRLARYDLEGAADWLITFHNKTLEIGHDDEDRQIALDAIYVLLGAHQHLSQERIDKVKMWIGLEKRLSEEKLWLLCDIIRRHHPFGPWTV